MLLVFSFIACKQKGKNNKPDEEFFPVLSILKSQVAHIDTSLYRIIKIVTIDSVSDTTYIRREEFRGLANDFLESADLTEKKYKKLYTESKFFDESLNRVIITYTPNKEDLEIKREELHIIPDLSTGDKIKTIIIDKFVPAKDSAIQKRLLWEVDERFQIVTTIQKSNKPDVTQTLKVIWSQP